MELNLRTRNLSAELKISNYDNVITQDIAIIKDRKGYIPDDIVENFITTALEMHRYNGKSDVDFVKMIHDNFLSIYEKEEFIERIND